MTSHTRYYTIMLLNWGHGLRRRTQLTAPVSSGCMLDALSRVPAALPTPLLLSLCQSLCQSLPVPAPCPPLFSLVSLACWRLRPGPPIHHTSPITLIPGSCPPEPVPEPAYPAPCPPLFSLVSLACRRLRPDLPSLLLPTRFGYNYGMAILRQSPQPLVLIIITFLNVVPCMWRHSI